MFDDASSLAVPYDQKELKPREDFLQHQNREHVLRIIYGIQLLRIRVLKIYWNVCFTFPCPYKWRHMYTIKLQRRPALCFVVTSHGIDTQMAICLLSRYTLCAYPFGGLADGVLFSLHVDMDGFESEFGYDDSELTSLSYSFLRMIS